jgi:hypothetical protein
MNDFILYDKCLSTLKMKSSAVFWTVYGEYVLLFFSFLVVRIMYIIVLTSVLQIQIRDPVLFTPWIQENYFSGSRIRPFSLMKFS